MYHWADPEPTPYRDACYPTSVLKYEPKGADLAAA
jgi:hypothetical protein